ncbi:MAG: hypothetical protein M1835_004079 [Candelina submexicana]|nr:MAG: hypothetical protein M1835_004079 [Candelina submexicana]
MYAIVRLACVKSKEAEDCVLRAASDLARGGSVDIQLYCGWNHPQSWVKHAGNGGSVGHDGVVYTIDIVAFLNEQEAKEELKNDDKFGACRRMNHQGSS